jgi:splicing factor 3B subunit 3
LRVLRHGVAITEMAVSQLPGKPVAVWTIKENNNEQLDKYIILSF